MKNRKIIKERDVLKEIIPEEFKKCPSCMVHKQPSSYATTSAYRSPIDYCDQCLEYIAETYSQYSETILKNTGEIPASPNSNIESSDFFEEFRYFSYNLDAHVLPEFGVASLPGRALFLDAPKSNTSPRTIIATFRFSGQRVEFPSLKAAAFHTGDKALFIKAQCSMWSYITENDLFVDTWSPEDKSVLNASETTGYQYTYKHTPFNIIELGYEADKHTDRTEKALQDELQKDIEDNFFNIDEMFDDEIDLDDDFDALGDI